MLWWVAQNLISVAILVVIVTCACWLGRLKPAVRHALWLIVFLKLMTPPLMYWPWEIPHLAAPSSPLPSHSDAATKLVAADSGVNYVDEFVDLTAEIAPQKRQPATTGVTLSGLRQAALPMGVWIWCAGSLVVVVLQLVRLARLSSDEQ